MHFKQAIIWPMVSACLLMGFHARAQLNDSTTILDWRRGLFPKTKEGDLYQIRATGFYRFFGTHMTMDSPYILDENSGALTKRKTLFIGDDSQLPNLLVNISGRPNKKVSWGFDVFAFQFLDGNINPTYNGQVATEDRPNIWNPLSGSRLGQNMGLNLGLNLYGSYNTDYGTFNVRMGGIHWYSISDLTLGSFQGYNRFLLFERNPWDPIGKNTAVRYNQMYEYGAVYQDLRWGERAVQGIILDGISLPNDWSFSAMYGKTELAGGFLNIPNVNYGGKIRKQYNADSYIGFNTLNNTTWADSLNTLEIGFHMHTLEWKTSLHGFDIHAEAGLGHYFTPVSDYPWGEAISAKILATEKILKFPVEVHYYRINPDVVNNNALFWNTSVIEARAVDIASTGDATQSANVLIPFASSMVGIGQMTNNRTGVNLNTEVKLGKLKVSAGYGVSTEIEARQNNITFSHAVNQLTRARFWRWEFPPNVGPYQRYDKVYRDAYQKVTVTDDSLGQSINPKKFNQIEIHGKYRTKINYRNFYAFFLGRYNTAQPELSIIPAFRSDNAYVRQYSSELELYYQVTKPLTINAYTGYERILGGYNTTLDSETFRPLNQTGWGLGGGIDVNIGRNAGLFVRHRVFFFEDTSFRKDNFRGHETLVELTVYF